MKMSLHLSVKPSKKARGIANRETAKRGWDERDCWSEVERSEERENERERI